MKDLMFSCDWGTSAFRLKLVNLRTGLCIGALSATDGIKDLFNRWRSQYELTGIHQKNFFLGILQQHINTIEKQVQVPVDNVPVILSGMIGSSLGLMELPYGSLPFLLTGENAFVHSVTATDICRHPCLIISGLATQQDVMRGEETQLIGLANQKQELFSGSGVVCILPGTHSKHVNIVNGAIIDFRTFMTGELFHTLGTHTVLKHSVNTKGYGNEKRFETAFRKGVEQVAEGSLLNQLFTVRTNDLLGCIPKDENLFYLSGLLIGNELLELINGNQMNICLCSSNNVFHWYLRCLDIMGLLPVTTVIDPTEFNESSTRGHLRIFEFHYQQAKI